MKIAVSGCWIAGAAVAGLLARVGHEVEVFEQAMDCRAVGAGILVSPRGQEMLAELGLLDVVAADSARISATRAVLSSGRLLVEPACARLGADLCGLGVHRGKLFQRLIVFRGDEAPALSLTSTGCWCETRKRTTKRELRRHERRTQTAIRHRTTKRSFVATSN